MSLNYYFGKARKTLSLISPYEREIIEKRCRLIQTAEEQLQAAGRSAFQRCYDGCEGLCCRNLDIDAVIGFSDFIYLLTVEKEMEKTITACLKNERNFFTADCLFLMDGKGPCLLPHNSRPEVCITTFCFDAKSVKNEISRVKSEFMKLNLYLIFLKLKLVVRFRRVRE